MRFLPALTCIALILPACGDDDSGSNNNTCGEGFLYEAGRCVPIFDACSGSAEIPVLGGGCQPVGVTECASGFESDGEGGCEPTLPSEPCPPGTMARIGLTECQPVGITECAQGFVSDGEDGCEAILPADPCPNGYLAIIGHEECQPIGDCGTDTWGVIEIDATTVFVDASADASGADGSQAAPFVTIQQAYDVVQPDGQIAVAAGEYVERLALGKPVRLSGRCAELVTIRGGWLMEAKPPVSIGAGGSGTTIRGVTLTGDAEGLRIEDADDVTLSESQVLDAGEPGIYAIRSGLSLDRVLVAGNAQLGAILGGSVTTITGSVVRDTQPAASGEYGRGIDAECDPTGLSCGHLTVEGSLVSANAEYGVFVQGVEATITRSVIRDTISNGSGEKGRGINARCDPVSHGMGCSSLAVSGSLIAGNTEQGIFVEGVDATIIGTVVRDTHASTSDGGGRGVHAQCDPDGQGCGSLSLVGSLVARNAGVGFFVSGVEATITHSVVRDTQLVDVADTGRGINAQCDPYGLACGSLALSRSLIAGNVELGVFVSGMETTIESAVIRDTQTDSHGIGGRGINAQCDPYGLECGNLHASSSIVASNAEIGVFVSVDEALIEGLVVRDTQPTAFGEDGRGINAQCDVDGRGCGLLDLNGSVVAGNSGIGISILGTETTINGSVVRDTQPDTEGQGGRGINARCSPDEGCGPLDMVGSLVAGSSNVGINLHGVATTLSGVIVLDTRENTEGRWAGDIGHGVYARCFEDTFDCGALEMVGCLVDSSYTAGVGVRGGSGSISDSVVRSVLPRLLDDALGYGVQVEGLPGAEPAVFDVSNSLIQDAALAGILYFLAGGTVSGTQISGVQYTVVMNQGANPVIKDDNDLSGSIESEPTWASMDPSPAPEPALPADVVEPYEP
ncbi:right-handed parallel beta-helix repeat-containing protein [Myxococcota bacterium]